MIAGVQTSSANKPSFPVRYALVAMLFALSGVAFLDRTDISIAGLQISSEFHLGNQRLGWIFSAFLIGYAAMQVPAGWMAARFGPRKVLGIGTLCWGVATLLAALIPPGMPHAVALLLALRFLLGAGESVTYPAASQFVARWIPAGERGIVNGVIFAGVGAGSGLTPPLLNWLITNHGWRAAFWFSASCGFVIGGLWWLFARDTPEEHPSMTSFELQQIRSGLKQPNLADVSANLGVSRREPLVKQRATVPWSALLGRSDLSALMLAYFSFGYISWIFFSWFFLYMAQVRAVDLKSSARYAMLPFLCMTICCLAGGLLSDWLACRSTLRASRCWLASCALCLTAIFLVLGSHAQRPATAGLVLAGGAGALYLSQSSFWSAAIDIAEHHAGPFSSLINMAGQIGGAVTASLTPWIAHRFGWNTSFAVAASFAIVGALCWTVVHPERVLTLDSESTLPASQQTDGQST